MHRFLSSFVFVFVLICQVAFLSSCKKDDAGTPSDPTTNPLNIETVLIPAGTFTMVSTASEPGRYMEELLHQVTLSTFRMSKYEITNSQYAVFLNAKGIGSNGLYSSGTYPSKVLILINTVSGLSWTGTKWQPVVGKENFPVVDVTWFGAAEFANYAGGRLPTEAEWEYACRSNTTTPFNTGNCLNNTQANYKWVFPPAGCTNTNTSSPAQTQAVNSYSPNGWGLHDMHGNVGEWCSDWFGAYSTTEQTNPTGLSNGVDKVVRGGAWSVNANNCRSACRGRTGPSDNNTGIGFRLAFTP